MLQENTQKNTELKNTELLTPRALDVNRNFDLHVFLPCWSGGGGNQPGAHSTPFPVIYSSSISNSKEIVSLNSSMACGREGHVKREMIATKFICPSILPSAV